MRIGFSRAARLIDLMERETEWGASGFTLQFMLDTSLSDADRFPLKFRDLMVGLQEASAELPLPALTDFVIMTKRGTMFLTGPAVVKEVMGEDVDGLKGGTNARYPTNICCASRGDGSPPRVGEGSGVGQCSPPWEGSQWGGLDTRAAPSARNDGSGESERVSWNCVPPRGDMQTPDLNSGVD